MKTLRRLLVVASLLVTSSARATPSLQPGLDLGIYEFVSANTAGQVRACVECSMRFRFAVSADVNLTIAHHLLLDAGFVSTVGGPGSGYPYARLLSFRADYLILDGVLTPYAGAGVGYLSQGIVTSFDQGTEGTAEGGAAVFETGLMLHPHEGVGRVSLCAQFVLPFFSISAATFLGPSTPPVTVPFFLFGLKLGL